MNGICRKCGIQTGYTDDGLCKHCYMEKQYGKIYAQQARATEIYRAKKKTATAATVTVKEN